MTTITARHPVSGRILSVRFEVRDGPDGWKLWAVPATGSGWAPIPMTRVGRGTAAGALVEFVDALFLNQNKAEGRPSLAQTTCTHCGGSGSLPDMTCCAVCGGGGRGKAVQEPLPDPAQGPWDPGRNSG